MNEIYGNGMERVEMKTDPTKDEFWRELTSPPVGERDCYNCLHNRLRIDRDVPQLGCVFCKEWNPITIKGLPYAQQPTSRWVWDKNGQYYDE